MTTEDGEGGHPRWLRVVLVGLQALAVVGGVAIGVLTYDAWSRPDGGGAATTTTVVPAVTEIPPVTLG